MTPDSLFCPQNNGSARSSFDTLACRQQSTAVDPQIAGASRSRAKPVSNFSPSTANTTEGTMYAHLPIKAAIAIIVASLLSSSMAYAQAQTPPPTHDGTSYAPPTVYPLPMLSPEPRSAGLAVALSLQPLPIDFGNLYVDNWRWGVAYTSAELVLLTPMMWMTGQHMNHDGLYSRDWSRTETGAMMGFATGYVLVKVAAALHAGHAAEAFNRSQHWRPVALVAPSSGGAIIVGGLRF